MKKILRRSQYGTQAVMTDFASRRTRKIQSESTELSKDPSTSLSDGTGLSAHRSGGSGTIHEALDLVLNRIVRSSCCPVHRRQSEADRGFAPWAELLILVI
jgi:hypothetical protein